MERYQFVIFGCILIANIVAAQYQHHHHHHQHGGGGYFPHHHHHGWPHHHDWHHGRHHHGPHHSFLNFEVREPKGLEISMIQKGPSETFFGIELYVDQNPEDANASCDVCYNTTEVINKKFIIVDPTVVIRKGDVLSYYMLSGNETNVFRHHLQKLLVTDSIINKCNCEPAAENPDIDVRISDTNPASPPVESTTEHSVEFAEVEKTHHNGVDSSEEAQFECDLDPATNLCRTSKVERKTLPQHPSALQREVQVLSEIINHMKTQGCTAKLSSNKLLLKQAPLQVSEIDEMLNFVQSYLSVNPELQQLGSEILRVMPAGPAIGRGVIFEMRNYVAKQKVLYYARVNNLRHVVDYEVAGGSF
ncbi:uncharacterized protein LOC128743371 [Sabethes cyaneus]|uniref:uncharacterized protein LOC128743371 n=1 Tax=Sabethes cyaneus TaxID=53552 RepID=UPI00237E83B5|nr:uncharacterized protein LOC128743371 [Sabethes cyaneus]